MDSDSYPVTTGDEAAIASRLEALAEQAALADQTVVDNGPGLAVSPALAGSLAGLRSEVGGLRGDLESMRAELAHQLERSVPHAALDQGLIGTIGATDDAVEERLAAIEDTLDGLAERFEALARDSAIDAGERLATLDDRIAALAQSVQAERTAAAEYRERSGVTIQDQAAALDGWAEAVRGGLEDLGEAVTGSLGSLSVSVSATPTREAERRHLEALVAELSQTVEEAFGAVRDQVAAYQAPLDSRLETLHGAVADGFGGARARLVEELNGTIARLEQANDVTRAAIDSELAALRGDLADTLDEVRERVESTVGVANESIAATLEAHRAASEDLRDGIMAAAQDSKDTGDRVAGLQETVARLDATLSALQSDWRPQVDAVVVAGRAAAQSVLEEMRSEVGVALGEMSTSLAAQVTTIRDVTGSLGGGTDRLVDAGQALLAYLAERDRWLERERDRMLHEVLDEFAQGLSAKERRAVSSRLREALDRRRDVRDAERFRRTEAGKPAIEVPAVSPEMVDLVEPVATAEPAEPTTSEPAAVAVPKPVVKAPAPAKAPAVKTAAKTVAKAAAPAKKAATATKTAATKKATPAKSTTAKAVAKKAAPRRTGTPQTGVKQVAPAKSTAKRTSRSSTRAR